MRFKKLALKNKEVNPQSWTMLYENMVLREIRKKYSVNQELALLRQRDTKQEEFAEYNDYVELCKAKVRREIGEGS